MLTFSDKNLIFLISQPRSGSSMLQQMLLAQGRVYSLPEPWLLLPLMRILNTEGIEADYNARFAEINLKEFLEKLNITSGGEAFFYNGLKNFIFNIYAKALEGTKCDFFLDKTPRYYHIIKEIRTLFPKAKIILLRRNPAAVYASILSYSFHGNYKRMLSAKDRIDDLYKAPRIFAKYSRESINNLIRVSYEDLVENPSKELERICNFLDINYLSPNYQIAENFKGTDHIDTKSVLKHEMPVKDYLNAWKDSIDTHDKCDALEEYLHNLGESTVNALGYSFLSLKEELTKHKKEIPVSSSFKRFLINNINKLR